jgi:hypothetical protein
MKNFQNKDRIIKVSRQLSGLARVTLGIWIIVLVMFLVEIVNITTNGGNSRAIYLTCGGIIEMLFAIIVTLNFLRFFNRLRQGELFDSPTVARLYAAGRWWLAYWIVDFAFCAIGNGWFATRMTYTFGGLFTALTIIFVAWLLKEARDLHEEQALTV